MNRPSVAVFIATSFDGYIARDDGSIDWLTKATQALPPGEDAGFKAFMASIDALVMGRNTFQQVLGFDDWPYGSTPVVVLSSREVAIPSRLPQTVRGSSLAPHALLDELFAQGIRRVYLDGGVTVQSFLAAGLVDELIVTLIPVILGAGRSLFGPVGRDVSLSLRATKTFACGFVQLHYDVTTPSARSE